MVDADETGVGRASYTRRLPVDDAAAAELKRRTLTKLYEVRPTWLQDAHRTLDEAVSAAYGLSPSLTDDALLTELLRRNLAAP